MLLTLFLIPLIGSILTLTLGYKSKEVALITSIITFIFSLVIWLLFDCNISSFQFSSSNYFVSWPVHNLETYTRFGWENIEYGIDGISLYLIILTTLLTVMIILNGPYDKYFLFWILISESILLGVFSVLDVLYFYILFEIVLIPLYFIMRRSIEIYPYRKNKIERAIYKLLGYTLFGSFLMLIGMILLYIKTGTTNYTFLLSNTEWVENTLWSSSNSFFPFSPIKVIWICFFLAFAVKVPVMPFHVWLPEAHSEAPTGGSMLLAGILLKLGTYGMIRYLIPLFPSTTLFFKPFVEILFVLSILFSSFTSIRQIDLKKLIAYTSVAHMNLCLLGIFSGEYDSITGGYFLMISHGLISSGLFFCVGILFNRYSLRSIKYYRGLILSMPLFSIFFFGLNLANIGFPGTAGFISEVLIFIGCMKHSFSVTFIASLSIILSGAYGIWLITRILYGRPRSTVISYNETTSSPLLIEKDKNLGNNKKETYPLLNITNDLTRKETYILIVLFTLTILFGLFPNVIFEGLHLPLSFLVF